MIFSVMITLVMAHDVLAGDGVSAFERLIQDNECVANPVDCHTRSITADLAQHKKRHDADVFAMWEKGISAEEIYRAAM